MEQLTTYTLRAKTRDSVWVFKYNLNGIIAEVKFLQMGLTQKSCDWLFKDGNFPYKESIIKEWKLDVKLFEIIKEMPDYSFETLWNLYDNKVKKFEAEKSFKKLKEPDVIKCFMAIKGYNIYLAKKQIAKAHLSTFINQRYFEDEWHKA